MKTKKTEIRLYAQLTVTQRKKGCPLTRNEFWFECNRVLNTILASFDDNYIEKFINKYDKKGLLNNTGEYIEIVEVI